MCPFRFEIRADNRRFSVLSLPPGLGLASRDPNRNLDLFFHDAFLSELDYGLVFTRRARYRLVWPFSIPADSPRDKRGRSCSRNRGLRFGIRADTGRFPEESPSHSGTEQLRLGPLIIPDILIE